MMAAPESVSSYFQNLRLALKAELDFEKEAYRAALKNSQLKTLVRDGLAWYPLRIKEQGFGIGEYPYLVLDFPGKTSESNNLKAGAPVLFFSQTPSDEQRRLNARIVYINNNEVKISFTCDDFPDWMDEGRLGILLQPDESSYEEMMQAIDRAETAQNCDLALIRDLLLGIDTQNDLLHNKSPHITSLNASQNAAVAAIHACQKLAIIHGPPGTGKTTTLVWAIATLPAEMLPVLVCAPSNAAADLLAEKLCEHKKNVLRIGNLARIQPELLALTPEGALQRHPDFQTIKKLKKQADEYRRLASKYKRNFGKEERQQRQLLLQEARSVVNQARAWEDLLTQQFIEAAEVIITTPVYANHHLLKNKQFEICIVDEAGQATAPLCWIPITKAKRLILAGDPYQLPPTVKSIEAQRLGLEQSLLELAILKGNKTNLLDTQYRMHQAINNFSNHWFYKGLVHTAHNTDSSLPPYGTPVEFIDTAGCGFNEKLVAETLSYENVEEAQILIKHLQKLRLEFTAITDEDLGIITPYKAHANLIASLLPGHITIDTVDAFQGRERSIIYISLVRSNDTGEIGFLREYRRMNVALTRAKHKLVVVGDSATLSNDSFYAAFIDYCLKNNFYRSAWELVGD